ncbi:MAG: F0F1 ATP synthase subunit B [Desulfobacterales bacterium]|jgi:F-type H+-transporting ATPase subunit b
MKIPGFLREFGHQKCRAMLAGIGVGLLCIALGTAAAASGENGGSTGWGRLDWFRLMNFALLVVVLFYLLRKPIAQALSSRIKSIQEQLESLEAQKAEAEKQLAQYNDQLSNLEREAQRIVEDYIQQGKEAKAKILKETEAAAEKLKAQARRNIEHEFEKAKQVLQREVLEKSLRKAEETLKNEITTRDQDKLIDEYLKKVVV